jgi:hypothetical protein
MTQMHDAMENRRSIHDVDNMDGKTDAEEEQNRLECKAVSIPSSIITISWQSSQAVAVVCALSVQR